MKRFTQEALATFSKHFIKENVVRTPKLTPNRTPLSGVIIGAAAGAIALGAGAAVMAAIPSADNTPTSAATPTSTNPAVDTDASPTDSPETTPTTPAPETATATSTPTEKPAPKQLTVDVSKHRYLVFTTPAGLDCGFNRFDDNTSEAYCDLDSAEKIKVPGDPKAVCVAADAPGDLSVVSVNKTSGWDCITEALFQPLLTLPAEQMMWDESAVAWYKKSPFPAAVKGVSAAKNKAYVPAGGVLKHGSIECVVGERDVQCGNTKTKAAFKMTRKTVAFAKERTYLGESSE